MSARELKLGAYGGLAGGLVFGAMMGMMGMLPMIGQMVGSSSSVVGFVIQERVADVAVALVVKKL